MKTESNTTIKEREKKSAQEFKNFRISICIFRIHPQKTWKKEREREREREINEHPSFLSNWKHLYLSCLNSSGTIVYVCLSILSSKIYSCFSSDKVQVKVFLKNISINCADWGADSIIKKVNLGKI